MRKKPSSGRPHSHQLRRGDEQPLMAGLAGPAQVASAQSSLELGSVVVTQRVEERRMTTTERAECLENR